MQTQQLSLFPYLEPETAPRPPDFIPIYEPWLGKREEQYVLDAVRSGWISSLGKYVTRFEQQFAAFCGVSHAVSVSNGTTALHLALHALGIGPGDEVIIPSLTFIASANAVSYTGATPVFADVDPATWCVDPADVARLITPRTRALMPVHLYGHPAPMDALNRLAERHNLLVVEDAAEAHGAEWQGHRVGGLGRIAAFSFYANKTITTGEGGMLTTDDASLAARCRMLRDHAMPPEKRYWHDEIGFNYRMTNLQAALGVAQMERIEEFIQRKRQIVRWYCQGLADIPGIALPVEAQGCTNIYWMFSVLINHPFPLGRDQLILALRGQGIDSRPFFHPMDTLPPYRTAVPRPVSLALSRAGLNLPSSPSLTAEQVRHICAVIRAIAQPAGVAQPALSPIPNPQSLPAL